MASACRQARALRLPAQGADRPVRQAAGRVGEGEGALRSMPQPANVQAPARSVGYGAAVMVRRIWRGVGVGLDQGDRSLELVTAGHRGHLKKAMRSAGWAAG